MQNSFQTLLCRGVGKDQFAHPGAVECTLCIDELGAEDLAYHRNRSPVGLGELMRDQVGVDDACAKCGEEVGDRAFAAADAAR